MRIDFEKYPDSLVPAIVQDSRTQAVLMLGYMNAYAYEQTLATEKVTFFSRSKKRIWVKGETSGNYLKLESLLIDCDADALLVKAVPTGPVCHKGSDTCFQEKNERADFLFQLEEIVKSRRSMPIEGSYTASLFLQGVDRIAQKVGEEAVELIIEAKNSDDAKFSNEAADLLFHFLVLLSSKEIDLQNVYDTLSSRHKQTD